MGSIKDKVAIVGMGCTKFGELWDKSIQDLVVDACYEAFEDARIEPKEIQAAWYASRESGLTGAHLARALKTNYIPVTRVENFCAGGQDVLRNACYGVASGVYDIALACGVEKTKDHHGGFGLFIQEPLDRGMTEWDIPPASQFGQYATAYFNHYKGSYKWDAEGFKRVLALIDIKNHHNGMLTPKAHLHREITVEDVLKSRIISWPFGLYDACGMSDGGAAAVVTTPEIAKSMRKDYILVKAQGVAAGAAQSTMQSEFDFLCFPENVAAAKAAYTEAGITNPREEISMAELHDCFSTTELITIEDLGFSPRGKAPEDIEAGRYNLEGAQPINPDGGLKCFGHPLSASGLRMTYEMYKQLQGKVDNPARQLKNPKLGLIHNIGGNVGIHVAAVTIFGLPE
ncbi:acetyl-CoA acetyltransferase [Chloroflexota bacterium]